VKNIIAIDDDVFFLETIDASISDDYKLILFDNPIEALESIKSDSTNIDIILSDIKMPQMDGYQLCSEIKQIDHAKDIPVIFLSGITTTDDLLRALEVGAIDHIAKPINFDLLNAKIHSISRTIENRKKLQSDLTRANYSAHSAFKSLSEIGSVIEFLQQLPAQRDYKSIANNVISFCQYYGLEVIIQIFPNTNKVESGVLNFSSHGNISPMTSNLLKKLSDLDKDFSRQNVAYFKQKYIALLVSNMPSDDKELSNRLSNYISAILNGACSSIFLVSSIHESQRLLQKEQKQSNHLNKIIKTVVSMLDTIEKDEEKQKENYSNVMNHLITSVEDSFFYLGLTEVQEKEQMNIVLKTDQELQDLLEKSKSLTEKISMLRALINLEE